MPMTKQERDELRKACDDHMAIHDPPILIVKTGTRNLTLSWPQLRELLDEAERWQAIVKWAQDRVHHEEDGTDHYYRGVGAACRAILDRVPAALAPQGEPEG